MKALAPTNNRETWLCSLAALMAPRFEELGKPIPPFRVSVGFTGGGRESNASGEAWHKSLSADGHFNIFITPDNADPEQLAAILCHELIHTAVGFREGHKGEFARMMATLGMARPYTCSVPGDQFKAWVAPFLKQIGPVPHAALMFRGGQRPSEEGGAGDGGEDAEEGGSSNQRKKQSTRMLKASCECGYTIRLSKKWALSHGATCPQCGEMEVEGLDED